MPFMAAAIPIAKVAGPLIMKAFSKWFGNKGKKKAEKEKFRATEEQNTRKFQSDFDAFENNEDSRQGKVQGYSEALQGNRALSPAVIAAAMKRRKNTAYKGSAVDQSKGMDYQLAGDLTNDAANTFASYNKEKAIGESDAGILAKAGQVVGSGGSPCPPGMQSDGGGCY